MEALNGKPLPQFQPDTDAIKRYLIRKGVDPTPKILHTLRKKQLQKHNRKLNRQARRSNLPPPLTHSQIQAISEEQHFQALKLEYKDFTRALEKGEKAVMMAGKPWEGIRKSEFLERARANEERGGGGKLKTEKLKELKEMFEARKVGVMDCIFDNDIEMNELWFSGENKGWGSDGKKRKKRDEAEVIRFLVDRLCDREITAKDWKFSRLMKLSGLPFTEAQLMRIVELLGTKGCWKQALSAVQWVYNYKDNKKFQSRFVYTKLLSILGKARRPQEALQIFDMMRGNIHIYPDMAAYHSIAVTLGQAGLLKELLNIVECMRQKPKPLKFMYKNWDPILEPDLVIYNAVLNACVPSKQWKAVSWVFKQLKKSGVRPNGATYGLAMEVMLESGNYDLVHELFEKMRRSGEVPKALTYKVLVRAFWKEGKVDEAVKAVRDMENRGVMGTASVYYELACCLCNHGRWQDAIVEVGKIRRLSHTRPLEVTFTGMITSSMDGGHLDDCICIFEYMKDHCTPNIGTITTMLKVYTRSDMFSKAKELYEDIKVAKLDHSAPLEGGGSSLVIPNEYTYSAMLEASASAQQWEYFEHVYRDMTLSGCQFDQNKNLTVLVEASRAGKVHLLEHAFDVILEAGEIPRQLFFFELVIQAISQHNYERAILLVNTMAYAPFRVTEKQWVNLFKKNEDRINYQNLQRLLDSLGNCDVVSEPTVSNLSRSLRVLLGLGASKSISSIIPSGTENTVNGQSEGIDCAENGNVPDISGRMMIEGAESVNDTLVDSNPYKSDTFIINHDQVNIGDNNEVVACRPQNCNMEDRKSFCAHRLECAEDLVSDKSYDSSDELLFDDDGSSKDDIGEGVLDQPSAYEILDAWKEMREEDVNYLHS